jgi:N-acetyl-anhydromuramyl-L-alanine amidase AmpD
MPRWVALLLIAACRPIEPHPPKDIPAESLRRVCLQDGLGPAGADGGSVVLFTGREGAGLGVETLFGEHIVAEAGPRTALCALVRHPMRICDGTGATVPFAGGLRGSGTTGSIARGSAVTFLEYVNDAGETKAILDVGGKARFVAAGEVCHSTPPEPRSAATEAFAMSTAVHAGPHAFRPRSTSAIRRIVIHNTECSLEETFKIFGSENAVTSAHVVVDRDGTMYRVVEDAFTAFHAGASTDALGGFNTTSLGIEVVAWGDPKWGGAPGEFASFAPAQQEVVTRLVKFWMQEYGLSLAPEIVANTASNPSYADLEYAKASVTIHRLTKAHRRTDCPNELFPNTPAGDELFFRWRESVFATP